jgi:hypothetical protein
MATKHIIGGGPHPYKKGGDEPHPHMKDGGFQILESQITDTGKVIGAQASDELREIFRNNKPEICIPFLEDMQEKSEPDATMTLEALISGLDVDLGSNRIMLRNMIINKLAYGAALGPKFTFSKSDDQIPKDDLAKKILEFWLFATT